jgi:hypothetical protein
MTSTHIPCRLFTAWATMMEPDDRSELWKSSWKQERQFQLFLKKEVFIKWYLLKFMYWFIIIDYCWFIIMSIIYWFIIIIIIYLQCLNSRTQQPQNILTDPAFKQNLSITPVVLIWFVTASQMLSGYSQVYLDYSLQTMWPVMMQQSCWGHVPGCPVSWTVSYYKHLTFSLPGWNTVIATQMNSIDCLVLDWFLKENSGITAVWVWFSGSHAWHPLVEDLLRNGAVGKHLLPGRRGSSSELQCVTQARLISRWNPSQKAANSTFTHHCIQTPSNGVSDTIRDSFPSIAS